jgi:hypothetical protein
MAKKNDSVKVVFGNSWTGFDGKEYDQGKTYSVSRDLSRHLLRVGKVRLADEDVSPIGNGATGLSEPTTK